MTKFKLLPSPERFLSGFYIATFVMAPVLSNKVVSLGPMKLLIGSLLMSIAFGVSDVINNTWGKERTKQLVLEAFYVRATIYCLILLSLLWEPFRQPEGYEKIVAGSIRIFIAGEVSVTLGQLFIDIPVFHYMKQKFGSFWLRYNVSNIVCKAISLPLFMIIAFAGTGHPVFTLIWSKYLVWVLMSMVLTPIFSLTVSYIKE